MSEQDQQLTFTGSPTTIGTDIFIQCVMPIIKQVQQQPTANAQSVAQFYAGFMAALSGCIAADFDKGIAVEILRGTADRLERTDLPGEEAVPH